MMKLVTYLVAAMLFWSPAKEHAPAPPAETEARYTAIATDIATVVLDENEQTLFPGDMEKAETGLQVAGMAFFESRFWVYVDDGRCNDRTWRKKHFGEQPICDGGIAFSLWQIQTRYLAPRGRALPAKLDGIALVGDGWEHAPDGYKGRDLLADRKTAARVALHMMRQSLRTTRSLCGYTGERGSCPKAKQRRELAHRYFVAHPFEADAAPSSSP